MDSLSKIIGRNIRELRRGKQMTQAELAGDEITRNMLSLIESGNASPSIATLAYLSKQLDVPIGYFFTDDLAETSGYIKMEIIGNIRELFANHEFEKCVQLCNSTIVMDDEIGFILAQCELTLADRELKRYHLASAQEHFQLALAAAEYSNYQPLMISQTVDFWNLMISSVESETISDNLINAARHSHAQISPEIFLFFIRLKMLEEGTPVSDRFDEVVQSPIYKDYVRAKTYLKLNDPVSAIPLLKRVLNNPDTDFYVEYRACCDLENCSNKLEDFKSAYGYAKKKLELLEKFKK